MFKNIFSKIIKNKPVNNINFFNKTYSSCFNMKHYNNFYINRRSMSSYFNDKHDFIYFKENLDEIKNMEKLNVKFGFSNYALNNLNNIVYAEYYKDIFDVIDRDDVVGNVESVKASIDVMPNLNGKLTSLNQEFIDTIQEHSEATIENIQEMSDYNKENGLTILEVEVDNDEINNILELIENNEFMNEKEYEKFLDE